MKNNTIGFVILLALLVSACGNASASPTISAESVQGTAQAAASTVMAETQAALPTNTLPPPTEIPATLTLVTDTPAPTATSVESALTVIPTLTPLATEIPTLLPQPTAAGADPCNKPLTSWQGPSANLFVYYEYKPQGKNDKVVLSLWVMTDLGECGFLSDLSTGPVGQYSAAAYVNGPNAFKVFGGFRIGEGGWKIIIRNDMIVAKGSCYPNC